MIAFDSILLELFTSVGIQVSEISLDVGDDTC